VARALGTIYREARLVDMAPFSAEVFLPDLDPDLEQLPVFPTLAKAGILREGSFPGLIRFECLPGRSG